MTFQRAARGTQASVRLRDAPRAMSEDDVVRRCARMGMGEALSNLAQQDGVNGGAVGSAAELGSLAATTAAVRFAKRRLGLSDAEADALAKRAGAAVKQALESAMGADGTGALAPGMVALHDAIQGRGDATATGEMMQSLETACEPHLEEALAGLRRSQDERIQLASVGVAEACLEERLGYIVGGNGGGSAGEAEADAAARQAGEEIIKGEAEAGRLSEEEGKLALERGLFASQVGAAECSARSGDVLESAAASGDAAAKAKAVSSLRALGMKKVYYAVSLASVKAGKERAQRAAEHTVASEGAVGVALSTLLTEDEVSPESIALAVEAGQDAARGALEAQVRAGTLSREEADAAGTVADDLLETMVNSAAVTNLGLVASAQAMDFRRKWGVLSSLCKLVLKSEGLLHPGGGVAGGGLAELENLDGAHSNNNSELPSGVGQVMQAAGVEADSEVASRAALEAAEAGVEAGMIEFLEESVANGNNANDATQAAAAARARQTAEDAAHEALMNMVENDSIGRAEAAAATEMAMATSAATFATALVEHKDLVKEAQGAGAAGALTPGRKLAIALQMTTLARGLCKGVLRNEMQTCGAHVAQAAAAAGEAHVEVALAELVQSGDPDSEALKRSEGVVDELLQAKVDAHEISEEEAAAAREMALQISAGALADVVQSEGPAIREAQRASPRTRWRLVTRLLKVCRRAARAAEKRLGAEAGGAVVDAVSFDVAANGIDAGTAVLLAGEGDPADVGDAVAEAERVTQALLVEKLAEGSVTGAQAMLIKEATHEAIEKAMGGVAIGGASDALRDILQNARTPAQKWRAARRLQGFVNRLSRCALKQKVELVDDFPVKEIVAGAAVAGTAAAASAMINSDDGDLGERQGGGADAVSSEMAAQGAVAAAQYVEDAVAKGELRDPELISKAHELAQGAVEQTVATCLADEGIRQLVVEGRRSGPKAKWRVMRSLLKVLQPMATTLANRMVDARGEDAGGDDTPGAATALDQSAVTGALQAALASEGGKTAAQVEAEAADFAAHLEAEDELKSQGDKGDSGDSGEVANQQDGAEGLGSSSSHPGGRRSSGKMWRRGKTVSKFALKGGFGSLTLPDKKKKGDKKKAKHTTPLFDFLVELQQEEEAGILDFQHETRGMHDAHIHGNLTPLVAPH